MDVIQSIILSKKQFGDGHVMLSLLSKEKGFLRVSAFGGQRLSKRFNGMLEYFRVLRMEVQSSLKDGIEYYNLCSVNEVTKNFCDIPRDVKKYFAASYVLELPSLILTENEDYFDIVIAYLEKINSLSESSMLAGLIIDYTLDIYRRSGFLCNELRISNNRLAINELRDLHYRLISKVPKTQSCLTQLFC